MEVRGLPRAKVTGAFERSARSSAGTDARDRLAVVRQSSSTSSAQEDVLVEQISSIPKLALEIRGWGRKKESEPRCQPPDRLKRLVSGLRGGAMRSEPSP